MRLELKSGLVDACEYMSFTKLFQILLGEGSLVNYLRESKIFDNQKKSSDNVARFPDSQSDLVALNGSFLGLAAD